MLSPQVDLEYADPLEVARRAGIDPDPWQQDFLVSDTHRVLMLCARQCGKSTIASVLADHGALYERGTLTLVVSPTLRQSAEFMTTCKDIYSEIGRPVMSESETALSMRLENRSRIVCVPAKPQNVRGFKNVRRIIIDEAAWVSDLVFQALTPMLAVSGGDLIMLSTPWGKAGWFYDLWGSSENWKRIKITADQCPRYTPEFLAEQRRTMPWPVYQREYLCEFTDMVGQIFPTDLIMSAFTDEIEPLFPEMELAAMEGLSDAVSPLAGAR